MFQYESSIDSLLVRQIIDTDLATTLREKFYDSLNEECDDRACEELIHQGHTTSLTTTPSLWIRRTHAAGIYVKQGKGGGVSAYPEIAADFHLWLAPKARLAIVRLHNKWL